MSQHSIIICCTANALLLSAFIQTVIKDSRYFACRNSVSIKCHTALPNGTVIIQTPQSYETPMIHFAKYLPAAWCARGFFFLFVCCTAQSNGKCLYSTNWLPSAGCHSGSFKMRKPEITDTLTVFFFNEFDAVRWLHFIGMLPTFLCEQLVR